MEGEAEQGQDIIVELVNRIRILESKYSLMSERLLVVNQNMIEHHKQLTKDIKGETEEIRNVKNDLEKVKNILKHLSEEAANFSRKDEVKLLEKYIKLWNPINFVTETDVKNILQRELRKIREEKESFVQEPVQAMKTSPAPKTIEKTIKKEVAR
jgi:flagellar motor component MotA